MPKFPDILLNNNPNAPSLDLNNLQVKGVGIFADAAARDALDSNLHTEGYLAIMKDTDTPFIYTGGTWTDAANWQEVKGAWEEVAGTTTDIRYLNGSVGVTTSAGLTEYDTGTGTQISHIKNVLGSTFPGSGQETVLHLHGGNLAISKVSGNGSNNFITLINGHHNISSGGYIGLRNYDMELGAVSSTNIVHYDTSGNLVGTRLLIASSDTPYGVPPKFDSTGLWFPGGILGNPDMKITMGGSDSGLQFYTHTNGVFHFMGLGVENSNYAAGIYLGTVQSGKVAYIRSSDSNTAGSYGYVGINVNNPSASGPAFEVSSSYGQFNTGLRVANSASIATMQVQGGQVFFTSIADGIWLQSVYNTTAGVSIGYQALASGGPGSVAIGNQLRSPNEGTVVLGYAPQAMTGWTAADPRSVLIGHSAGMTATTASDIIAIGNGPLGTLTSGSGNIALGRQAGSLITTESRNVFIGYEAGRLTTGGYNVFIGNEAGENETGSNRLYISNSDTATPLIYGEFDNNIVKINGSYSGGAIGLFPQNGNTNSYVAIGDQNYFDAGAGSSPSKGLHILFDSTFTNTGYGTGVQIGHSWNMGYFSNDNVAIGNRFTSTATNSQHIPKIMIGNGIDLGATTNNAGGILIGASSFPGNMGGGVVIGGTGAAFNGVAILASGHEGSQGGTAILGESKGYSVTIGASAGRAGVGSSASGQKVYVGINAGSNSAMTTAVGANAGRNMTGFYNTALGANAIGLAVSSGASANTAVGDSAGYNLTGSANTFVGARAAISTTSGSSNVALGGGLGSGTSPALNANTTGSHNISLGINSLETAVSASRNIALGTDAGKRAGGNNNIFLGYRIAHVGTDNNTSISDNIVLGYQAGHNLAGSKNVLIGYEAGKNETGSNKLYISNSNTTTPLIYGEFDNDLCRVNGNFQRVVFGSTETTTSGTIHIRDNTDWSTQADATNNTASTGLLGIALGATANVGLVLFGDVDYTITGNVGTPVYLDTTAGGFTTTAPTGSGNIVRVMGYIIGSNKIFFNPSNDWLEIV